MGRAQSRGLNLPADITYVIVDNGRVKHVVPQSPTDGRTTWCNTLTFGSVIEAWEDRRLDLPICGACLRTVDAKWALDEARKKGWSDK